MGRRSFDRGTNTRASKVTSFSPLAPRCRKRCHLAAACPKSLCSTQCPLELPTARKAVNHANKKSFELKERIALRRGREKGLAPEEVVNFF